MKPVDRSSRNSVERLQGPFDVHAVLEDAIQDQVADLVVVVGPGETMAL
jgi:hypothetical protein